jgi:radical SAM superfamily enzyme YgiQ (UPF0313 family)
MRTSGAILLVSCYELGHQPFHLASLNAMLRQAGYAPVVIDTAVETLDDEAILNARFVAISVPMHTALRLGTQVARHIRAINHQAHICFYGLYALLNADFLLRETIDSAIGGEYEAPLLKLIAALEQEQQTDIPGVRTRQYISGPWIERTTFTTPERELLPKLDRYARLEVNRTALLAGYTETTRGCKHTCLHCPITPVYGGRFFAVPAKIVLADIRAQVKQGARHITFGDPDFFNGPTHALRITRAFHQEFPQVTFDATIKVEHLLKHHDLLAELKTLGCAFIVSAVESLNADVLHHLDKGHSSADIAEVFDLMDDVKIPLRPSLLPFSPWETLESYIGLLNFVEERRLIEHIDPVHFSIRLLIPPGSALLDQHDGSFWLGDLDEENYTYRWRHPDPRMDELQKLVLAVVEDAEQQEQTDPINTFFQVKALALSLAGDEPIAVSEAVERYGERKVLPHLTESWFC